jgi:hypothetical protein
MDVSTGLTILGSAVGGAKVVEKLLGPTSEYVGVGLKNWTERRVENVKRIFSSAAESLGEKIDQPGSVPPKVLKEVLEEGSFNDDRLACEYFGGVLASSRTPTSRDDRGASLMKLVSDLTTYQIRTHYIFYAATKKVFDGQELSLGNEEHRQKCSMFLSLTAYFQMMEFGPNEDLSTILTHSTFGLYQHGLIGNFEFAGQDQLKKKFPHIKEGGIQFIPTARGVELFMWACGLGSVPPTGFLQTGTKIPEKAGIRLTNGFSSMKEANQAPEPTAMAVTSPAAQEPRQP